MACPAADQAAYAAFVDTLQPVRAGETQLLVVTNAGVDVFHDGVLAARIPNRSFGENLIRSLLGPTAPTAGYRDRLLGNPW